MTGRRVPDGTEGEIVFSTLNREAMPLIRYRTGDRALRLPGTCPCGAVAPRIGKIRGRFRNELELPDGSRLSIHALDELLYAQEPVLGYTAELTEKGELVLSLLTIGSCDTEVLRCALRQELGLTCPVELRAGEGFFTRGTIKREIKIYQNQGGM